MRITRLGQGVDATGRLAPDAIDRTVAVLRRVPAVLDRLGVEPGADDRHLGRPRRRPTATSSSTAAEAVRRRRAPSCSGGEEEARLSFLGATAELDPADGPFLVVDIGGGSTEFAVGHRPAAGGRRLGRHRLRAHHREVPRTSDPPAPEELTNALTVVRDYLDDVVRELPAAADAACLVGLAGTVTTVAAVELGHRLRPRPHPPLPRSPGTRWRTSSAPWPPRPGPSGCTTPAWRRRGPTSSSAASCSWPRIMRYFGFDECLVSEADILDGLVLQPVRRPA